MIPTTLPARDIWTRLAAALPNGSIAWRQDGKPSLRDGKWFARFVCYVEAGTVRERLDAVVPGEWDLTLELLPPMRTTEDEHAGVGFKARLQVLGVIREDVGQGGDFKSAATDAFKRAAVRFGIGHELYAMEQNWVQVDSDSKFAKALEDPQAAYNRRYAGKAGVVGIAAPQPATLAQAVQALDLAPVPTQAAPVLTVSATDAPVGDAVPCPKCGGKTWDNRVGKKNPKAPDFKCRDKSCDGVIWPPKVGKAQSNAREEVWLDSAPLGMTGTDEIPF